MSIRGLTKLEVARRIGESYQVVHAPFTKANPKIHTIQRMLDAIGASWAEYGAALDACRSKTKEE